MQIAQTLRLGAEDDCILWKFEPKGVYNVNSMYVVVNFRGIIPVYVASVWDVNVLPKIQFFLWHFVHNRLLTRDNLAKR